MPDKRLPKKDIYKELQEGKRSQGGQKKCYKDTLRFSLKDFNIPTGFWGQDAQDRAKWRCLIRKGTYQNEAKSSLALLATDSLELKLTQTSIKEHTITHEHKIFRIKMVIIRETIIVILNCVNLITMINILCAFTIMKNYNMYKR